MTTSTMPSPQPVHPPAEPSNQPSIARALLPLAIDVAVPLAVYAVARAVLGASLIDALILSSVVPVVRTLFEFARDRRLNAVAALMLSVNLAGVGLSFATGNVRLGTVKSAAIGGVIAIAFLVSVLRGRPLLSEGMRPFVTRGMAAREAAWGRLHETSTRFRLLENRFTLIYGGVLLVESAARVVIGFFAPVSLLGWLPSVVLFGGLAVAVIVSGGVTVDPIIALVDAEVADADV